MKLSTALRRELAQRAEAYAKSQSRCLFYRSIGTPGVVLFEPYQNEDGDRHGNFLAASYQAILANPAWNKRLARRHQRSLTLPENKKATTRETDSCNSSDALLMNIFCHPHSARNRELARMFDFDELPSPDFGFKARVPKTAPEGRPAFDKTEIDLYLSMPSADPSSGGPVIAEAKLTESDFTQKPAAVVEAYSDLNAVFNCALLTQKGGKYDDYQVIRNVLAAFHYKARCVLLYDARRPDLCKRWLKVVAAIKDEQLRCRCGVILWQRIAAVVCDELRLFMNEKYGIHG